MSVGSVALICAAYLIGTFPSAVLVARANGVDISTVGSGNPGASNVTRVLGWRKGLWVYVLDAAKGALAPGVALALDGRPLAYWCGAAAIVGHMFPAFRRFRGGKGVATGSGVLAVLHPLIAVAAAPTWWILSRVTGKAAIGSIVVVALIPLGLALFDRPAWEYGGIIGICALILAKHAGNVSRLLRREEHSLSSSSS
ncbi:MAG: glycerol-3-phosphate acyltransferase [Actinomycetota bacterium]